MSSYSYILITRDNFEPSGIVTGIVNNLDEAQEYYDKNVKKYQEPKRMSNEELVQRALLDNWEIDYFENYVEVWNGTQKINTFKFNTKTRILEEK